MSEDFWDDETVKEFLLHYNNMKGAVTGGDPMKTIKQFKKAKQKLFTTEDGVPKYPMDKCWVVNKDLKSGVHSWSDLPHNLNDLNWDFSQAYYFHDIEKAKEFLRKQKPLFTTEDGKDIFIGDKYCKVNNYSDYSIVTGFEAHGSQDNYKGLKFSTEAAAKDYIVLNKPCLSIMDLTREFDILNDVKYYDDLKELVEKKINNGERQ